MSKKHDYSMLTELIFDVKIFALALTEGARVKTTSEITCSIHTSN